MLRVLILLGMVALVTPANEGFYNGINTMQSFAKCLGDGYYQWYGKLQYIRNACYTQPMGPSPFFDPTSDDTNESESPEGPTDPAAGVNKRDVVLQLVNENVPGQEIQDGVPTTTTTAAPQVEPTTPGWQANFEPMFGYDAMKTMVFMYQSTLTNLTCTLQGLNMVDANLNVNVDGITTFYRSLNLSAPLTQDLIDGVNYCNNMAASLPLELHKNLLSMKWQRILSYLDCEEQARSRTCYKNILRNSLFIYNTTALPDDGHTSVEDRLSGVMMGVYSIPETMFMK